MSIFSLSGCNQSLPNQLFVLSQEGDHICHENKQYSSLELCPFHQDSPGIADSIWQLSQMEPLAVGSFLMLCKGPSNDKIKIKDSKTQRYQPSAVHCYTGVVRCLSPAGNHGMLCNVQILGGTSAPLIQYI